MAARRVSTPLALLVAAALIGLGLYLNRGERGPGSGGGSASSPSSDSAAGDIDSVTERRRPADTGAPFARLSVSPEKVELGSVPTCGVRRTFEVALANDGDKPLRVDGWVSTCACVAPAVVATRFQYTWSLHIFIAPLALTTRDLHHRGCWRR